MPPLDMQERAYQSGVVNPTPPLSWSQGAPAEVPASRTMERPSAGNLRTAFRSNIPPKATIRPVTPEAQDFPPGTAIGPGGTINTDHRGFAPTSPQTSPRSIPGGARRQG